MVKLLFNNQANLKKGFCDKNISLMQAFFWLYLLYKRINIQKKNGTSNKAYPLLIYFSSKKFITFKKSHCSLISYLLCEFFIVLFFM